MGIPSSLSETAAARQPSAADDIVGRLAAGDAKALAKCITLMESGGEIADLIHRRVCAKAGRAAVIGFTGAPGAGKSTLIDAYIGALRSARADSRRCRGRSDEPDFRRRHSRRPRPHAASL